MGCGIIRSASSKRENLKSDKCITKVDAFPDFKNKYNISKENIHKIYKITNTIGQGYFSKVKMATLYNSDSKKKYAVKIIKKKKIDNRFKEDFLNELSILKIIDHPNIIKLFETYEDENNYYLVMEHLIGGDLFSRIERMKEINEAYIALIFYKIISAINYCHSIGVVHRDIKPDNILFEDESDDAEIKILDFGLSRKFSQNYSIMHSFIGTPYFVAPEVIKQEYNYNCDMWSIGATAYMLFTGQPPFNDNTRDKVLKSIQTDQPDFSKVKWGHVSNAAVDFVKKLLVKNPKQRMTSQEALKHRFFTNITSEIHNKKFLDFEILKNLRHYQIPHKFTKIVLGMLIETLDKEDIKKLNDTFHAMDLDHEGFISLDELKKAFEKAGLQLSEKEINEIIERIDSDKNGKLNYTEFVMASINIKQVIDNQRLNKLFKKFDIDNTGFISVESMMKVFLRSGRELENVDDAVAIIRDVCKNENAKISYDEFFRIMTN
jgi:calcium-dependent protein kinase